MYIQSIYLKSYIGCGSVDETYKLFGISNSLYHKGGRTKVMFLML